LWSFNSSGSLACVSVYTTVCNLSSKIVVLNVALFSKVKVPSEVKIVFGLVVLNRIEKHSEAGLLDRLCIPFEWSTLRIEMIGIKK